MLLLELHILDIYILKLGYNSTIFSYYQADYLEVVIEDLLPSPKA
jgi:hypothetical protein